jgi:hypothetical protein
MLKYGAAIGNFKIGELGTAIKYNYSVFGTNINIASRLINNARPNELLLYFCPDSLPPKHALSIIQEIVALLYKAQKLADWIMVESNIQMKGIKGTQEIVALNYRRSK